MDLGDFTMLSSNSKFESMSNALVSGKSYFFKWQSGKANKMLYWLLESDSSFGTSKKWKHDINNEIEGVPSFQVDVFFKDNDF